jgi:hypothetical protein
MAENRHVINRDSHNRRFEGDSGRFGGRFDRRFSRDSSCSHVKSPSLLRESFRMNENRLLKRKLNRPQNRLL